MGKWTLFSNHGHVLTCLARDSEARLRDVAMDVGITERAVQKIVRDLQDGGMISVTKNGRRNSYRIHKKQNLRHVLEEHYTLKDFLTLTRKPTGRKRTGKPAKKVSRATGIDALQPPEKPKPGKPKSEKPKSENPELDKPKPEKTDSSKSNTSKSRKTDKIERQQGSLF